jgi:hypothetical protein
LIYLIHNKLFIAEFKYSVEKSNQSLNGICCINFKQYKERTLNFLKRKRNSIGDYESRVDEIIQFSIACKQSETDVYLELRKILKSDLDLKSYKNFEFIKEMRNNRKHFLKIMNFDKNNIII